MRTNKIYTLVLAAMFTALCCIGTIVIQVPSINGYVHLGDGFVILSGIFLGPLWGSCAAGIGSMLADLLSGYPSYAIATLLIKGIAALLAGVVFHKWHHLRKSSSSSIRVVILGGIIAGVIVTSGYFFFDMLILHNGFAAASDIPGNLMQNVFGIVISSILYPLLSPILKRYKQK